MNAIDLYYINKAKENVEDEYFTEIQESDLDNIRKAKRKMFTLPLMTLGATYLIKMFRDRIFISNNFLINIMSVRKKHNSTQYKSKTYDQRKDDIDRLAEPYQNIKQKSEEIEKLKQNEANLDEVKVGGVLYKENSCHTF